MNFSRRPYLFKNKNQRINIKASFLLLIFLFDLFRPYVLNAKSSTVLAIDNPVSDAANDFVDLFTGDFRYSVPLAVVTGPNGESVDISASYHGGGIKVDQASSWIGLGWDLSPGEISRSVIGTHDDNAGYPVKDVAPQLTIPNGNCLINTNFLYGILNYNKANNQFGIFPNAPSPSILSASNFKKSHDIFKTDFVIPGVDNYVVSGPGIGGKIRPYVNTRPTLGALQALSTVMAYDATTQFDFVNTAYTPSFDATTKRFKNGYFIKYYLNSEINNSNNLFNNNSHKGFLDYRVISGTRRPVSGTTPTFDDFGIGGFEITDPKGVTYHYSLPVYSQQEVSYSFDFDMGSKSIPTSGTVQMTKKEDKYAQSWKLTAITGPDYVDVNQDFVVNEGDKGYWIAYNYSLWCDAFLWSSSYYNFNRDLRLNGFAPTEAYWYWNPTGAAPPIYKPKNNLVKGRAQIYYLNTIKTASHTAFFVKDVRSDEISYDKIQDPSKSPVPSLKLNKIVVMRNEDATLFNNAGSIPASSGFDLSSCNPLNDLVHIGKYNLNKTAIDLKSLKTVEFGMDYSLCKKYHKNINNTFNNLSRQSFVFGGVPADLGTYTSMIAFNFGSPFIFSYYDYLGGNPYNGPSDPNQSGKLTLNEIKTFEVGKTKIFPSYKFEYGTRNPDYNNDFVDFWGHYKSNFNRELPSKYSFGVYQDAWLMDKITTPLGGTIKVTYGEEGYSRTQDPDGFKLPFYVSSYSGDLVHKNFTDFAVPNADFANFCNGPLFLSIPVTSWSTVNHQVVYDHLYGTVNPGGSHDFGGGAGHYNFISQFNSAQDLKLVSQNDYICSVAPNCVLHVGPISDATPYFMADMGGSFMPGGGVYVSSITIKDPQNPNLNYSNIYQYSDAYCHTAPFSAKFTADNYAATQPDYDLSYNEVSYDAYGINPVVTYGSVSVSSTSNTTQGIGLKVYEFSNMSNAVSKETETQTTFINHLNSYCDKYGNLRYFVSVNTNNTKFTDNYNPQNDFEKYGKLLSLSVYDKNFNLVSSVRNNYVIKDYFNESAINMFTITQPVYDNTYNCGTKAVTNYQAVAQKTKTYSYSRNNRVAYLSSTEEYKDGIVTQTIINDRDQPTAQPVSTTVVDPTQGAFTTEIKLAYKEPAYFSMGLKGGCTTCEGYQNNLLTPSEVKIVKRPLFRDPSGALTFDKNDLGKLIGGSQNIFSNQPYYRVFDASSGHFKRDNSQVKSFWKLVQTNQMVVDANTAGNSTNYSWRNISDASAFNSEHQGLMENKGLTGRISTAVKMGYNNQFKLAEISDANLDCFAFSSFEDGSNYGNSQFFGGEISGTNFQKFTPIIGFTTILGISVPTSFIYSHSGNYVAKVPPNNYGPGFVTVNFETNRTYKASVWVHSSSPASCNLSASLDGSIGGVPSYIYKSVSKNDPSNIVVGDWILMTLEINVPANYVASAGTSNQNDLRFFVWNTANAGDALFDDFSVHPVDAGITGYVYNPITGWVTAKLDNENFATFYNYDQAGRIIKVSKETATGVKKVSETSYNFGRP